mmetsp:Transcript_9548/g.16722  ORF Transcript_9548/g.16722 Transcript_9548/m.16722 type:complete len:207 (-) Transcript_9548:81-701(-)
MIVLDFGRRIGILLDTLGLVKVLQSFLKGPLPFSSFFVPPIPQFFGGMSSSPMGRFGMTDRIEETSTIGPRHASRDLLRMGRPKVVIQNLDGLQETFHAIFQPLCLLIVSGTDDPFKGLRRHVFHAQGNDLTIVQTIDHFLEGAHGYLFLLHSLDDIVDIILVVVVVVVVVVQVVINQFVDMSFLLRFFDGQFGMNLMFFLFGLGS